MTEPWRQWCPLLNKYVSRGECNACNEDYLYLGVRPFLQCVHGHAFKPIEALSDGKHVICPVCKRTVMPEKESGGGVCCEHIDCKRTCDRYGNPDRCNMARDPDDARKFLRQDSLRAVGSDFREYPYTNPETGKEFVLRVDEYGVLKHQMDNQEALSIPQQDLQDMGKQLSTALSALKFLHRGQADQICRDIQATYNRVLRYHYPSAKVVVRFTFDIGKPKVDITAGNSVTSWLLHELQPYVSF